MLASSESGPILESSSLKLLALAGLSVFYLSRPVSAQQGYCAFEVRVTSPGGSPIKGVAVSLSQNRSQLANFDTDADGVARICDAPLKSVDIAIGKDICQSVHVLNAKATFPLVKQIFVIYQEVACNHFIFLDRCQALLRIQSRDGRPISGAQFESERSGAASLGISDKFGRLYGQVKLGEALIGIVRKAGYRPEKVLEKCTTQGESDLERRVTLTLER